MNDYSDLIYLLGAIAAFSLLSLHTNRMLQMNSRMQINAEIEYNAVSIAQDQIDQIRWIRTESEFISHQNSFPKEVELNANGTQLVFDVDLSSEDITIPDSNVENKRVTVSVTNQYLILNETEDGKQAVSFQFIKSFTD